MKKRLLTSTLLALMAMFILPIGMRGQTIAFDSYSTYTAEGAADNLEITTESGFKVYLDGGNKSKISAKSLTFVSEGATTANDRETFAYQYNPGGGVTKTSGERSIKLTIPKAGKLYVYPRIGSTSNSSSLSIQQNNSVIVNKLICESGYTLTGEEQYYTTTIGTTTYYNNVECSVSKGDAYIITGNNAINFSAFKFVANTYTVQVTAGSGGTITVTKGSDDVTTAVATGISYEVETSLTLTASPNDGYHFVGWKSGDTTISANATYEIGSLSENTNLVAVFAKNTYALTTSGDGVNFTLKEGSSSGADLTSPVEWGTTVYVSAAPTDADNYYISSLTYTPEAGSATNITGTSGTFEMPTAATVITATATARTDISTATITLSDTELTYTGSEIAPTVSSVSLGETLTKDVDYTVNAIEKKTEVGTGYTVTITGIGKYKGTASATWAITPAATIIDPPTALASNDVSFANLASGNVSMSNSSLFNVSGNKYTTNSDSQSSIYIGGTIISYSSANKELVLSNNYLNGNGSGATITIPGLSSGQVIFAKLGGANSAVTTYSCTGGSFIGEESPVSSTSNSVTTYADAKGVFITASSSNVVLTNAAGGFRLYRIAKAQKLTTSLSGATGDISISPAVSATPAVTDNNLGNGYFVKGTEVTVTAPDVSGFNFVNWTNGSTSVSTNKAYTFTLNDDTSLTANYEEAGGDPEKTVSTVTTWTFNNMNASTYTASATEVAALNTGGGTAYIKSHASEAARKITIEGITEANYSFDDDTEVTVSKIAKAGGKINSPDTTKDQVKTATAGNNDTGYLLPTFAFNTSVSGTVYALMKGSSNDVFACVKSTGTSATRDEFATKATGEVDKVKFSVDANTSVFIGDKTSACDIYAVRFVPSTYKYAITLPATDANGNKVTADKASAAEGETVTLTVTPASEYQLKSGTLKVNNGDVAISGSGPYTFTMPAKPVTVTAEFETTSATTYAVSKASATNGNFEVSPATAASGATVTVTTSPASGYEVDAVSVTGGLTVTKTADNTYTFAMPANAVTVTVTFKQIPAEETVSEETTWTFNSYTTSDTQTTCAESSRKQHTDKLYNRSASSGRGFTIVELGSPQNITFSGGDQDAVTISKIASTPNSAKADVNNMKDYSAGTAGNNSTAFFAFNTTAPGTCYAYVKSYDSGNIRIYFGKGDGTEPTSVTTSSTELTEIKLTSGSGGTFFVGGVTNNVQRDIYAIRFVPLGTTYTITGSVTPTGGGSIKVQSPTGKTLDDAFEENSEVTLLAVPAAGYKFKQWSGTDGNGTSTTLSLTMDGNKSVTGEFETVPVYGTFDFRTFASEKVSTTTDKVTADRDANGVMTGSFTVGSGAPEGTTVDGSMQLNGAIKAGRDLSLRKNNTTTSGLLLDKAETNVDILRLSSGDWIKFDAAGVLKFSSTNVHKAGSTTAVAANEAVESGAIYIVDSGTEVNLTFGPGSGVSNPSYIYSIQVSNAAIPPSVVYKGLEGDKAVYTVTYDATSTLYYKLPGASDYTSTTEGTESGGMKTIELKATQSGTLEVYSNKGGVDTEHVTETVSVVQNVTLTLDEAASDNTKKVYKVSNFKSGQKLYFQRPQDSEVKNTSYSDSYATTPYTLTATDNGELLYYVVENGVESQHATITVNTIITRPNATLKTLGEEKSIYTLTFSTGNTVTYKVPGGTDKTISEGKSLDIDIPQSGQLIAYATMGSLKSDSLKTNVYVKTPSIVENGKYDFALLKDKIADYVLGTRPGEAVTVGGLTLKKPDDVVENTLNRFAFTARYTEKTSAGTDRVRDTDWRLLSAGRLRANKGTVADTMAILNLTKGQYLSIEYSGADLKYMSQSTAKLAEGTDVLKSKQAYEILSDGALLLVVPANADKTCDIFVIEVAGDETVTAPTLEARTENGSVVPNAVTLRMGTSNFGNTVTAYYTTDGSTPAANNGTAMTASGKITVDVSCTIKAICISSSGVKSGIAEYKIDLTQAGQSPAAVYNFADMVAKGDTLQFSKTATSTVYNMEKSGSTWEVKGRSDFYRVTNLDSNNKISVRAGAASLVYDNSAGTMLLRRAMAIHDLGVGDEVVIMYSGTGSLINVNSDRGDEFTVDGKTVAVGEEISSGKTIKITGTKYGNNYIVVNASGTVYINAIYINRSAPSTVTRPKIELREVGTETARYRITFDDGARLYYVLEKEGAERRGSDNGTFDLTIDESDRISAWAVKSGTSSDTLTTVIYAPTPAPSEAGDYDFYEPGSELPADLEVTLDATKSVTVDGQTLYKPTAMTAQTFNDKFAFTETNTSGKIKIRTNRTLAFNKGADMNMALLNMRRGDIISFDYTGSIRFANSSAVSQDGGSAARTRAESGDGSKMVSGAAYVVQQDGNVLLNLELTSNAITVAKMYVNAAPGRSKAAAIDFASALEEEEEVDMEGAAGVWCNERDAMVKFVRFANNSDELPINNKVSTENGYGTLEMNGFTSGNRNIAIHSLTKGDTIKVRFSGGDVFYYGHATYGNRVSVNGKTLQPGDAIKSGDVLKVEKVDYLNNYVVLRLGSKAAISGLFINIQEVEKVIRPTITTKANNTFTIMAGISTIGSKVTTCYTTNGTEPTLFNGTSGPYDSFDVQVLRGQNMTIKAISYSETGVVSKVMSVYYNGVDLTPIDDIMIDPSEQDDQQEKVIYDLMGRRVQTPQPGRLYIINGKKVIYNKR